MKTIILASSNKGKIKEIKEFFKDFEVLAFSEVMPKFEIVEDGKSFKENAIIKAKAIYEKLENKNSIVLADDSGISVPALGYEPGIYSARYAGEKASDKDNLFKLIDELKKSDIKTTPAFYTASMAIATNKGIFTTHGWMHGKVIDEARGKNGFGYDPMFIPAGYDKTLGELDKETKQEFSHRTKALKLVKLLLK
jgi:XTP/dITP diphosphohydrolase